MKTEDLDAKGKAALLILETGKALAKGCKHYRASDNRPLTTVAAILEALSSEGRIIIEPKEKTPCGHQAEI